MYIALGGTGALLTRQLDMLGIRRYSGWWVEGGSGTKQGQQAWRGDERPLEFVRTAGSQPVKQKRA